MHSALQGFGASVIFSAIYLVFVRLVKFQSPNFATLLPLIELTAYNALEALSSI
jgi:hypothetical protein